MQTSKNRGMTLVQRGGLLLFTLAVTVILLAPSSEARRTNIQGGDDAIQFFTNEVLSATTPVTSSVKIPVGNTEGLAVLLKIWGMTTTGSVTLTRLERIRANETVIGYPIIPDTGAQHVILGTDSVTTSKLFSEPFTEGIEHVYFMVESLEGGVTVNGLSATQ